MYFLQFQDRNVPEDGGCTKPLVHEVTLLSIIILILWHICSKQELWSQRNSHYYVTAVYTQQGSNFWKRCFLCDQCRGYI
jgi:hypothetical protein